MISIPSAHKTAIKERPTVLEKKLIFTLVGGDVLTVTNANIWQGSLVIEESICNSGQFEIGSTHINQMSVSLFGVSQSMISDAVFSINSEGHLMLNGNQVSYEDIYENVNFNDATVAVWLASPGFDYFLRGTYTVVTSTKVDSIINITAYDFMDKFSRDYSQSTRTYPCTLKQIVAEACTFCGVTDDTGNFSHYNQSIAKKPDGDDKMTFREVIGYVAQICGYNAKMTPDGHLKFVRYNLSGFNTSRAYDVVAEVYSSAIEQDVITITGFHVDEENVVTETDEDGIQTTDLVTTGYDAGTDGYVISIAGNPLIKGGLGQSVVNWLYSAFGNKPFRIGSVTHSSDPCMEASDIMKVTDRHATYNMLVSQTRFSGGEAQTTSSNSLAPRSSEAVQYTDIDKIKTVASEAHIVALAAQGYANQAKASAKSAQASADAAALAAQNAQESADAADAEAKRAKAQADQATADAATAQSAANTAQDGADRATEYAGSALIQLSEVEQVLHVLEWIAEHGTYTLTEDTEIIPNKNYYVLSDNVYVLVTDPKAEELSTYYELHVDEAISNFINTHLTLLPDGLYVIKGVTDYRLRVANEGVDVLDSSGRSVAFYGESARVGREDLMHMVIDGDAMRSYNSDGECVFEVTNEGAETQREFAVPARTADAVQGTPKSVWLSFNLPISTGDTFEIQWAVKVSSQGYSTSPNKVSFTYGVDETKTSTYPLRNTDVSIQYQHIAGEGDRITISVVQLPLNYQGVCTTRLYYETTAATPTFTFGTTRYGAGSGFSASFGEGMDATSPHAFVVGKYNECSPGTLFAVGNGSATSAKNALEVDDNGDVRIENTIEVGAVAEYEPTWATGEDGSDWYCVVSAGICHLMYQGQSKAHSANTLLFTLPNECVPSYKTEVPFVKDASAYGFITIATDGTVTVKAISSTTVSGRIYINCSFPIV